MQDIISSRFSLFLRQDLFIAHRSIRLLSLIIFYLLLPPYHRRSVTPLLLLTRTENQQFIISHYFLVEIESASSCCEGHHSTSVSPALGELSCTLYSAFTLKQASRASMVNCPQSPLGHPSSTDLLPLLLTIVLLFPPNTHYNAAPTCCW